MQFGDLVLRINESVSFPLLSAFLIGILASVSPCPLATNITAMAYVSRNITDRRYVVTSGILYTLGRTASYFTIGALIIIAGVKIPHVADALQDAGEKFLGPILLIVGIIMLDIIKLPALQNGGRLSAMGERVAKLGRLGAFLLGVIFALAFCPYSAILFFGIVIPLGIESTGGITVPASYAIGTGLPVLLFGILLSVGITRVSRWLNIVTASERIIRKIAALVFIGTGIYYIVLLIQN